MVRILSTMFFSLFFANAFAQLLGGTPGNVLFLQKQNKQAKILFPAMLDSTANHILKIFAKLDTTTKQSIGNKTKQWNVVLQHQTVIPNAYVRMAPKRSEFYMTPDFDNNTSGTLPWATLLATHEYRHIQQFSNFNNGLTKLFSFLLGEEGQLLANGITIPDYFFEGDAVFQETITTQQGRGQLPAFYSGMQALWNDGKKPNWMQLRNGSYKKYYPNHYETGYQLVAYGYEKYGPNFWKNVTNDASSFKGLFYAFAKAIKKYSGVSYKQFRNDALTFFKKPIPTEKTDFITYPSKTVTNYYFATAQNNNLIALKNSNTTNPTFVKINNGKITTIRRKDFAIDNYFSCNNNQIVYSSYQTSNRWDYKNYSDIKLIDIATGTQKNISFKTKLFQPAINENGTQIVAVNAALNGATNLILLNTNDGTITKQLVNKENYIYTYPKFLNNNNIVSIVRNSAGANAFVQINTTNNTETQLTPFSFKAMGYPFIKNDTIYFTLSHNNTDIVAALDVSAKQCYAITTNTNSVFYPTVQNNTLYYSKVTSSGQLIAQQNLTQNEWQLLTVKDFANSATNYLTKANENKEVLQLPKPQQNDTSNTSHYKKGLHLFKLHSYRPSITATEYKFSLYSNNILNTMSSTLDYTYNVSDKTNNLNFTTSYGGFYPFINFGTGGTFNRKILDAGTLVNFNTARIFTGINVPITKVYGRNISSFNVGTNAVLEQVYYTGISKNVFKNKTLTYLSNYAIFSNQIQSATQHIYPRWAQSIGVSYRDALSFINSRKLVINSNLYFPGFAKTHNTVIRISYQNRDTLRDYFSNSFAFARGYEALNTRRMVKLGMEYHFPILYPDFGFGNIAFLQRIRAAFFADYNNSKARVSGILQNIKYKSIGTEIYFDGKIWNALPINIGIRYTRLLNKDLLNPLLKNRWEIILPLDIVPN